MYVFFMYLCPNGMRDVLSLVPSGYKYIFVYPEGSRDVLSLPLGLNTFSVVVACTFFVLLYLFFPSDVHSPFVGLIRHCLNSERGCFHLFCAVYIIFF